MKQIATLRFDAPSSCDGCFIAYRHSDGDLTCVFLGRHVKPYIDSRAPYCPLEITEVDA